MANARVNFAGITAYPRFKDEDKTEVLLHSCSAPVRDHPDHKTLDVVCNTLDEVQALRDIGVVELSLLDTYVDSYEDKDGEEASSLNATFGSVMARGDW